MRTIIFYTVLIFYVVVLTPKLLILKLIKKFIPKKKYLKIVNDSAKKLSLLMLKLTGSKVTVIGEKNIPKTESVLFISNHQGNFDIPLFLGYVNKHKGFIAKKEMLKLPLISSWMKELGCLFLDRSDIKQSARTILEGIKILKSGYSLVVFPEGTRSKSNKMGKFKSGTFKLAVKSQVPIIPITIDGSYKIMESNSKNKIKPADVVITIHKPIYTKGLTDSELDNLHNTAENVIISKL